MASNSKKVSTKNDKVEKKNQRVGSSAKKTTSKKDKIQKSNVSKKSVDGVTIKIKNSPGKRYNLLDAIKKSSLYGKGLKRSQVAIDYITENAITAKRNSFVPGQLMYFNYFEPKFKEELEYYDANPCTIFFGKFNSKLGKRYLGFNIHYYPAKLRYLIMNKIFEIYQPIMEKYFSDGIFKEIDAFTYKYLVKALRRKNLAFGVREYIPELIAKPYQIPPNMWEVAAFTEGNFKKETRAQIMKFWESWLKGTKSKKTE